ncbi:g7985 [Coccomyxa viridis]|uniref:G7985 protein n=1 Tax=Coccomyxa viridis TaxID=1274662 RepID=A0ABP1G3R1_9CHLO
MSIYDAGQDRQHFMLTTMDTLDSVGLAHASPAKGGDAEETESLPAPVPAEQGHVTSTFLLASLPSRLGALWTSAEPGPGQGRAALEQPGQPASRPILEDRLVGASSETSLESLIRVSRDSGLSDTSPRQSEVERAWETVDDLAPDEDEVSGADYRSLTKQLKAVGDQAPATPLFGSSPEAGSGYTSGAARMSGAFTRTLDMLGLGARPEATGRLATSKDDDMLQRQIPVERIEALLLWQDPYVSAKVFGAGLYMLICLRHLVCGVELLQPSTALAGLALFALLYSALARMWSARRAPLKQILDKHPLPHEEEAQLQASFLACTTRHEADATDSQPVHAKVASRVHACADLFAPVAASITALAVRRLSGRDSMATTVWLALTLWLVMMIGELGIVTQSVMAMWLWIALFTLPFMYRACRHALDALVEETLLFVAEVVRGGERTTLSLAGGVLVLLLAAVDASVFARVTIAVAGSGGILIWRARRLRAQAHTSLQSYPIAVED